MTCYLTRSLTPGHLYSLSHGTLLGTGEVLRHRRRSCSPQSVSAALHRENSNLIMGGQMARCDCSSSLAANLVHPIICYPVLATIPRPTQLFISSAWFVLPFRLHALEQSLSFYLMLGFSDQAGIQVVLQYRYYIMVILLQRWNKCYI